RVMSTAARRRLMKDLQMMQKDPPPGVGACPTDENIMVWKAVILGPDDTAFEGGVFKLSMTFTEEYPNKPPAVKFLTSMFHPNVYADGSICLDILQNQWSTSYDVRAVLTSLQSLLGDPNPHSPANMAAAELLTNNCREYTERVSRIVEDSWRHRDDKL
ncbi:hypothetical protein BOX15_Mlig027603g1, partial [Macrostomum lignano]